MAKRRTASLEEDRKSTAKHYKRLQYSLAVLPENPGKISEQQLRELLYNEKYLIEDLSLGIRHPPIKEVDPQVDRRLEKAIPPPTRANPSHRRSAYEDYLASNSYQDKLNKELEPRRSYKEQLKALSKEDLIAQVNWEREARKNELEELKPKREWWNQYPAEYEHWGRMPYWSVEEGIALSLGCDPEEINLDSMKGESYDGIPSEHTKRHEIAARSVTIREIDAKENHPIAFLAWLVSKGHDYPDELAEAVGYHQRNAEGMTANPSEISSNNKEAKKEEITPTEVELKFTYKNKSLRSSDFAKCMPHRLVECAQEQTAGEEPTMVQLKAYMKERECDKHDVKYDTQKKMFVSDEKRISDDAFRKAFQRLEIKRK